MDDVNKDRLKRTVSPSRKGKKLPNQELQSQAETVKLSDYQEKLNHEISIDFGLDEPGKAYSSQIANNVIAKISKTLGIADDQVSHMKLKEYFVNKFAGPENPEFFHNVDNTPRLEMISAEVYGYKCKDPVSKAERVSAEASKIRE